MINLNLKPSKFLVPFEITATFSIQVNLVAAVESYYKEASLVASPKD